MTPLWLLALGSALLCALAAIWLLRLAGRLRAESGVPAGAIRYSDTGTRRELSEPLRSTRLGLVGKPDYLIERRERGRRVLIPVEVKSGRAPSQPHPGHLLQVGAYCLLVEETLGVRPPYALLRYADRVHPIANSDALRAEVLGAAAAMRNARHAATVPRSHNTAGRCAACGYRADCDEALV
jgi:CRISPR-associated exonuclease Cas4